MDEDLFNMQVRKFLKNVGVTSQREIEGAVRAALGSGKITEEDTVTAKVTLTIDGLDVSHVITGDIRLSDGEPDGG